MTRKNPPGAHSTSSVDVNLPAGPNGLAFSSLSLVQRPTNWSIHLCSGPGFGGCCGGCASVTDARMHTVSRIAAAARFIVFRLLCRANSKRSFHFVEEL